MPLSIMISSPPPFFLETETSKVEFIQTPEQTIWLLHHWLLPMLLLEDVILIGLLNQLVKDLMVKTFSLRTSGQQEKKFKRLQTQLSTLKCSQATTTPFLMDLRCGKTLRPQRENFTHGTKNQLTSTTLHSSKSLELILSQLKASKTLTSF